MVCVVMVVIAVYVMTTLKSSFVFLVIGWVYFITGYSRGEIISVEER